MRVPELCCAPAPKRSALELGGGGAPRRQLQQTLPQPALCPSQTPELPTLGTCPYTTGMVVYCIPEATYYLINNTVAVPYTPNGYLYVSAGRVGDTTFTWLLQLPL